MTGAPSLLADLLTVCEAHGIRLALAGDGGLTIDAPQDALTPELLDRLKAYKAELLAVLRPAPKAAPAPPEAPQGPINAPDGLGIDPAARPGESDLERFPHLATPRERPKAVCRCGCPTWRDVPIHGGQSVRRDCGRCGRFIDFAVWHGKETLQNEN